ncbi:GntR family transcriptional regulator, partial [Klebsiella pneumoniae]|uniref:GntR family transcriptional regulator n=2 Tax=Pseudomonadota TaxID=1224 RepID=UPI003EE18D77
MNSGPTAERVHEALKRRIMGREFRPGDRLDPAVLAAPLSSSVTPVRDALHLLTGEGLVE